MSFITSAALAETGYVVLSPLERPIDPAEWRELEYIGWRSSGVTRFAPLASYAGEIECNGFWNQTPPRTDKDGIWIPSQVEKAPTLTRLAQEPGANVGRCRVIELQPNTYADAVYNLHQDDNNRLNDEGTGWVVRSYVNLTDDSDSLLILREDRFDPATEQRLALPAGTRMVVDTQRFWHAVWHRGSTPRYSLITSLTSGPELDAYIAAGGGTPHVESVPLDPALIDEAQVEQHRRIEERRRAFEAQGIVMEPPVELY
ncbi:MULTISPECIES: aspartyl/asparaginyl beta-hydroxylase domain-containing protein [unclassified Microbacterium]|uniref:aspartyl/asparaginyl beta-hydroxylase domain-containing protein n=1 Tax=unclassified Microbacterium TaxID=2609290 RepID=UPI001DD0909A|nr:MULTISPECIES: aspartyl/asparaginyl beta-hydroxylase domain-containing protein [unclassified Microbacterium]CAH0202987.1 hypothetical protein SRABI121_02535 [Microbacterium sp. Bi121]HWK78499.1 aspartyl/asparaginyl beta-hydroxylase domain-containing protein [Microbacterium sp.]